MGRMVSGSQRRNARFTPLRAWNRRNPAELREVLQRDPGVHSHWRVIDNLLR